MKFKIPVILFICFSLIVCASSQKRLEKQRAKDPQYQYNVGLVYLQNDRYDDAVVYLNKSLALKPDFDLALNALGIIYFIQGEFQKAMDYLERCLTLNPEFTEARNYLGSVYQELGHLDKAEAEFKKAIADETYRSRELPHYNLARLYLTKGKDEEALKLVNSALELNDRMVMALNLKGVLLERDGKLKDAIYSYETALNIAPGDINLSYNLAVAYFKSDRRAEAKALFEKIHPNVTDEEIKGKIDEYLKVLR
ncbi:MAG: tetratricopeptide repeat protein [Candidatus Aminicenantes bacterium]|nr:MAG: tetratricopeptide repeat protein [Candidatus Aminicenantes bacterium]